MFEQSLYEQKPVAAPLEGVDLFNNYEIKSWDMSSRIYQILGISVIANILAIVVIAQASLLTMKGCDSPLVGSVCQVLDTVYVGTMLFGTEREYVDQVYEKTDLADSEITFIDVSNVTPPLPYPEGYFQLANPIEYQASLDMNQGFITDMSQFPTGIVPTMPSTGGSLLDTQPNIPQANPNVIDGELPTFNSGSGSTYSPPVNRRSGRPRNTPNLPDVDDMAENPKPSPTPAASPEPTPLSSEAVTEVQINKKPLTDFADEVATRWDAKEIDLNQNFMIVMDGVITKDGKLDRERSKFDVSKEKGDPKMIAVGKSALEALADSGYLTYLSLLGVEKVTTTLVQDEERIMVVMTSAQKTPERAKTLSSQLGGVIMVGKTVVKNPSDERTLLDGAITTSDGKNFVLNFAIPKPIAQEMINRKLKEAQAKKAEQPKPNGNLPAKPVNNTAQINR